MYNLDISIIIVNWNTKDLLIECIKSIYATTHDLTFEIWVVDNGSIDDSANAIREFFPQINIIENPHNFGFAKACNQAMRQINSKYAVLLNTDTILTDRAIKTIISFMDNNSKIGICGGQLLNADGSKQNSIANIPNLATELFNKSLLRMLLPKKYIGKEHNIDKPIEVDSLIGAFLVIRKEAIDQVGLMDESYFFFFEETDWCLDMKKKGWLIYHHPDAKAYHLQGQTAKKVHVKSRIEYWRSRYLFFKKHYGNIIFITLMIGLMLRLLVNLTLNLFLSIVTLFTHRKAIDKCKLYFRILQWHCMGLPRRYGLR